MTSHLNWLTGNTASTWLTIGAIAKGFAVDCAAADAAGTLRQIEDRRQAPDHPSLWGAPETEYLKFYLFQVV